MKDQKDKPNFGAWQHDNLARLASELYDDNIALREANEQLRLDLKDAMKLLRETNK